MATQDIEVNESTNDDLDGILTLDDLENPESNDPGEAIVEDPENAPVVEEKETLSETSTDDKPTTDEPTKVDEVSGDVDDKLADVKPVEGETPRERALREEVTRLRRIRRVERGQKMFKDVSVSTNIEDLSEEDKEVLAAFDPEQVSNMEKLFAIQAKKLGFVKKDEFAKQTFHEQAQNVLDDFLEKHPEYDESNDPDGLLWGKFQKEYSQYKIPENPKDLGRIFNKIHKEVFGITTDTSTLKKVEAQQEKIKIASHSASSGASSTKSESRVDDDTKKLVNSGAMKGFSDEDLKELGFQ